MVAGRDGHRRHLRHLPAAVPVDRRRIRRSGRRHRAADGRRAGGHRPAERRAAGVAAPAARRRCWSWPSAWRSASTPATRSTRRAISVRACSPFVAGWGSGVFTAGNGWWWVPIVGADASARVLGAWLYDVFVNKHHAAAGGRPRVRATAPVTPSFVLALDQGTTSSRAIVFGRDGRVGRHGPAGVPADLPGPGPRRARSGGDLAIAAADRASEAIAQAPASAPRDIAAIGVTNQRETTVLWEKATGKPVANAIVWQSRITAPICDRLKAAGHEPTFREKTGLVRRRVFLRHEDQAPARHRSTACARAPSAARSCSAPSTRSSSGG